MVMLKSCNSPNWDYITTLRFKLESNLSKLQCHRCNKKNLPYSYESPTISVICHSDILILESSAGLQIAVYVSHRKWSTKQLLECGNNFFWKPYGEVFGRFQSCHFSSRIVKSKYPWYFTNLLIVMSLMPGFFLNTIRLLHIFPMFRASSKDNPLTAR